MIRRLINRKNKIKALLYGAVCHGLFLIAGLLMFVSLYSGFSWKFLPNFSFSSYLLNIFLIIQFPFFHSLLLTRFGKKILRWFYSAEFKDKLDTTVYASIASFQLIILFAFWQSSGVLLWVAEGSFFYILSGGYLVGWFLLSISSIQAGFGVQTGSLGWIAVYKETEVRFPDMPTRGLFKIIRHPIYLSFAIILWISPYLTLDKVVIGFFYVLYCYFAPRLKEKRFLRIYGERFRNYQSTTPYFIPRIKTFLRRL